MEKEGFKATVVNARFAKPLDEELILRLAKNKALVLTLEEGTLLGGFGSAVLELFERNQNRTDLTPFGIIRTLGIPDRFIDHGKRELLLDVLGLSALKVKEEVIRLIGAAEKQYV